MSFKKITSAITVLIILCLSAFIPSLKTEAVTDFNALEIANGIIAWKKSDIGADKNGYLINEKFLELAGTTPGDWYPIGLGRLGIDDNYDGYLAVIKDQIEKRYSQSGRLSVAKATEWHRISLAVLASGGDPTNIGKDTNGNPINLIADGVYNRGKTTSLGRQGINGWIWGLIALDGKSYEIPDNAYNTREDIIKEIICRQLKDGGFALSGSTSDPDITAMAIQALSTYYNSEKSYTYTQKSTDRTLTKAVYEVIDEALECLSALQLPTGDFASWGTENVESTDQVAVALCCLGIDPLTDERFIKNGNTLIDGILRYRMEDGGFVHSFTYDSDNPTSLPDRSNTMAGEQTLYTMAALIRHASDMRTLYDFRPEQSTALKKRISELEAKISKIDSKTSEEMLTALLKEFYSIPENERSYVSNYRLLSIKAKICGIDILKIADITEIVESPPDTEENTVESLFSEADRRLLEALPDRLTTEQYALVTSLLDKLERSPDFDGKEAYLKRLKAAKEEITELQTEIDSINAEIKEKLYPFEKMSLRNKKTVDGIIKRYNALGDYDKSKIERIEDVIKTETRLNNTVRAVIISVILFILTVIIILFLIKRIKRRIKRKETEMAELAAEYKTDESSN